MDKLRLLKEKLKEAQKRGDKRKEYEYEGEILRLNGVKKTHPAFRFFLFVLGAAMFYHGWNKVTTYSADFFGFGWVGLGVFMLIWALMFKH